MLALRACQALHNGQGGLDWAGLPVIAAWLGVQDLDGLIHRMVLIKRLARPSKPDSDDESPSDQE